MRYSLGEEVKSVWGVKGTFLPTHGLSPRVPPDRGTSIVMELSLWSPSPLQMQNEQEGRRRPVILWVRGEEGVT